MRHLIAETTYIYIPLSKSPADSFVILKKPNKGKKEIKLCKNRYFNRPKNVYSNVREALYNMAAHKIMDHRYLCPGAIWEHDIETSWARMLQYSSAKCCNEETLINAHKLGHKCFNVKYGFLSKTHPMFIICSPMADFVL